MDKDQKMDQEMDTSNKTNGDQEKERFSPTKYIADLGHLRSDRTIKTAEIETRMVCYKAFKAAHEDITREHPTINQDHFRRYEDYQLAETSKRIEEIKTIDKKMQEVREQARELRRKN